MRGRTLLMILLGAGLLFVMLPLFSSVRVTSPAESSTLVQLSPSWLVLILILAIPLVAIIGGLFVEALRVLKGDGRKRGTDSREQAAEEARMIQEMHRGMSKLEARIESLETILHEREQARRRKEHDI